MENQIENENLNGNGVALLYGMQERMIDFVTGKIRLLNPNKFSL